MAMKEPRLASIWLLEWKDGADPASFAARSVRDLSGEIFLARLAVRDLLFRAYLELHFADWLRQSRNRFGLAASPKLSTDLDQDHGSCT
jgi:hypothetical protein